MSYSDRLFSSSCPECFCLREPCGAGRHDRVASLSAQGEESSQALPPAPPLTSCGTSGKFPRLSPGV